MQVLGQTSVDLMLSDIIMPAIDGYQLAEKVQSLYPTIKIQLVSGYADQKDAQKLSRDLRQNLLTKPYKPEVLLARIRQLLDEKPIRPHLKVVM